MPRPHQPSQSAFGSVLPEEVDWKAFPAFPPSARLAVIRPQPWAQSLLPLAGEGARQRRADEGVLQRG
jgi:hypothetical protein